MIGPGGDMLGNPTPSVNEVVLAESRRGAGWGRYWRVGIVRYSGLYGIGILILVFSLTLPGVFATDVTFRLVLQDQSIGGLLALAALIPLAAGTIDLAFAYIAGLSMVVMAWLNINTGIPTALCILIAMACAIGFGVLSGLIITFFDIDSLIVTLGTGTVALGVTELLTSGSVLPVQLPSALNSLGDGLLGPVPVPAVILLGVAVCMYVWLEHTPSGRRLLATGNNRNAARAAGIKVAKIQFLSLVASSVISGFTGILLLCEVGSATDTSASAYLLPAIAALFLGTTQVINRVNVAGTIVAVYLLGVGIKGLELHGAAPWVQQFFDGLVLLVAVTLASRGRVRNKVSRGPRRFRGGNPRSSGPISEVSEVEEEASA
jgi:ribose transport system permease protein